MVSDCGFDFLICVSLRANGEYLFTMTFCISSLEKCPVTSFAP